MGLTNLANNLFNSVKSAAQTTANKAKTTIKTATTSQKKKNNTTTPTTTKPTTTAPAATTPAATTPAVQSAPSNVYNPNIPISEQVKQRESQPYKASEQVQNALAMLKQYEGQKPQGYESKYGQQMDELLAKIQNPEKFKYEFNGDELFKYYADLYTQNGRQASMDAMGQAAALTGGYGNSYAQQAGNQAYDEYLRNLYDKGFELRNAAYQQYLDQQSNQYNQYNLLNQADQTDYGRYRDTVADWQNNRDYYANRYDTERNYDYGVWNDQRSFDEQQWQFDQQMAYNQMSDQQKYAVDYVNALLANGQMPGEGLLQMAGLSAADAQKLLARPTSTGGGGGRGKGSSKDEDPGLYYVDNNGKYYTMKWKNGAMVRSNVAAADIPQNAKVHSIYEEGNQRRK